MSGWARKQQSILGQVAGARSGARVNWPKRAVEMIIAAFSWPKLFLLGCSVSPANASSDGLTFERQ